MKQIKKYITVSAAYGSRDFGIGRNILIAGFVFYFS